MAKQSKKATTEEARRKGGGHRAVEIEVRMNRDEDEEEMNVLPVASLLSRDCANWRGDEVRCQVVTLSEGEEEEDVRMRGREEGVEEDEKGGDG